MLFIDTSSLVKYYYPEPDSAMVEAFILQAEQIYISNLTIVEMASALQKKVRMKELDNVTESLIWNAFISDIQTKQVELVSLDDNHYLKASELIRNYGGKYCLRTLDSLHLAVAHDLKSSEFLCSDTVLSQVAVHMGIKLAYISIEMVDQDTIKKWLQSNCPAIWSLLNSKAKNNLPKGIIEYIGVGTREDIEKGREKFKIINTHLTELKEICGENVIGDKYRKDISGVDSENSMAELFCEISLCATLGKISSGLVLRPSTGKGTYSDCYFKILDCQIYGEVKRYSDPWPHQETSYKRSIGKKPIEEKPYNSKRPRSMDLRSKLQDTHKQFPDDSLNILFVFHPSFGKTESYLAQTLFGDSNFFKQYDELKLEEDGLFYDEKWKIISACCLARTINSRVSFEHIWKNPRASIELPESVLNTLLNA